MELQNFANFCNFNFCDEAKWQNLQKNFCCINFILNGIIFEVIIIFNFFSIGRGEES